MDGERDISHRFEKVTWFFSGKRLQDSSWSWVVCISAAVCNAVSLGFALSFGVLFPELMEYFNATRQSTAWVGSVSLGMIWLPSPLAGYLCDRFGYRIPSFLGGMLCIVGLVLTSFAQSLAVIYFTYSMVFGLGACFIYNSIYLAIGKYFKQKLSVATGITALGSSIGVLYTAPLLQVLLDSFEWRNALRIMAASFTLVCLLSLTFNPNVEETTITKDLNPETCNRDNEVEVKSGMSFYCSVWTFPVFTIITISLMFGSFGMYIPIIYLVKYCEDLGITAQEASRLFIFIGLASSIAKPITGRVCNDHRVNPVFIYQSSLLLAGVSALLLPFATKYWALVVFSVAYGLSDGMFITVPIFILLSCVDNKRMTASFSIENALYAVSAGGGGPIAGLMADQTGNYINSFYMTGGVLMMAFSIPFVLLFINRGMARVHPTDDEEARNVEATGPTGPQADVNVAVMKECAT